MFREGGRGSMLWSWRWTVVVLVVGCGGVELSGGGGRDATPEGRGPGIDAGRDGPAFDAPRSDVGFPDGPSTDAALADTLMTDSPVPDVALLDTGAPWSPVCPALLPPAGETCSVPAGTTCEYPVAKYGDVIQFDVNCDLVMRCLSLGGAKPTWQAQRAGACQPDGTNPASCPASSASITPGKACSLGGVECQYSETVCWCAVSFGGPPPPPGSVPGWTCEPGSGCPMPRPRLGTVCTGADGTDTCTYMPCEFTEVCQAGVWTGEFILCE